MGEHNLNAISPIDGRYASKTSELNDFFSEKALMKYRLVVEIEYFISLCESGIPELNDFDGLVNTHFFSDKIFKNQTAVCTYREPIEWYFSQWNYARQRHRGEFHRLINSKIFRLKHFKRSLRVKYLSSFKIFFIFQYGVHANFCFYELEAETLHMYDLLPN